MVPTSIDGMDTDICREPRRLWHTVSKCAYMMKNDEMAATYFFMMVIQLEPSIT